MRKFIKDRVLAVFAALGLTGKKDQMTNQDWNSFNVKYKETYGISFEDDLAKPEENPQGQSSGTTPPQAASNETTLTPELQTQILAALNEASQAAGTTPPAVAPATVGDANQAMITAMGNLTSALGRMAKQPENNNPLETVRVSGNRLSPEALAIVCGHSPHTQTHLFGISHKFCAR